MNYVIDTHTLLWYITSNEQLSKRVEHILDVSQEERTTVIVPSIVLVEAVDILEKGKIEHQIDVFIEILKNSGAYTLAFPEWDIIEKYREINQNLDIHDRLIVATALKWDARILTKDAEILKYYGQFVVW